MVGGHSALRGAGSWAKQVAPLAVPWAPLVERCAGWEARLAGFLKELLRALLRAGIVLSTGGKSHLQLSGDYSVALRTEPWLEQRRQRDRWLELPAAGAQGNGLAELSVKGSSEPRGLRSWVWPPVVFP